jgi:tRNA G18 (ribose-2'-O)-methylase SpoU
VGVELDPRAKPLNLYAHRERAMYLLGAEDHGLPPSVVDRCHDLIAIPTPATYSMNVACAGSVVMSHRHMSRLHSWPGQVEVKM